jgi:lantibiotic modifying enzyme
MLERGSFFKDTRVAQSSEVLDLKINHCLERLDDLLFKKFDSEPNGLLSGSGGASLYFKYRFLQSGQASFLEQSILILESEIRKTNLNQLESYLSIGSSSASSIWLIDQLISMKLLDEEESSQSKFWVDLAVESTFLDELESNRHDLFYGFIGKGLMAIEHNRRTAEPFIIKIVDALLKNIKYDADGGYWMTPKPPYIGTSHIVNLGIPHGILGILLFLFKCVDIYDLNPSVKGAIDDVALWIRNRLTKENNLLPYEYSDQKSGSGNLGWCYGDLGLTYTLFRHYKYSSDEKSLEKANKLLSRAASREHMQGVWYYPEFNLYDMCLCHGTSSIMYMYKKIFELSGNSLAERESYKWLNETVNSLEKYFQNIKIIESHQYKNFNTSCSLLNGLSGVGLVLLSFANPSRTEWDKVLLLDH